MKEITEIRFENPSERLIISTAVTRLLTPREAYTALLRHRSGDWGDVGRQERQANDEAMDRGGRLRSAYRSRDGTRFLVITEADRFTTTMMLADED